MTVCGQQACKLGMFARCKFVKVSAGSCHPAKQHGVSIQAETDILKWTAFRNGLFDAYWLEAGLESSAGYGYTTTGVKGPQAPIKPKTGGGGLPCCCFVMACARAGETETAAAKGELLWERHKKSPEVDRGYYTLHSISKTSVHLSTQSGNEIRHKCISTTVSHYLHAQTRNKRVTKCSATAQCACASSTSGDFLWRAHYGRAVTHI
jgi:hypothetical protein